MLGELGKSTQILPWSHKERFLEMMMAQLSPAGKVVLRQVGEGESKERRK